MNSYHTKDISEWAAGRTQVQLNWLIQSDPGLQFGGWTIDDVCLYTADEEFLVEPEVDAGVDAGTDSGLDEDYPTIKPISGCGCENTSDRSGTSSILELISAIL